MPRESARKHRVAAAVHRLLNELLLSAVKDPRLGQVRVSEVEVTGDLSLATVFFNTLQIDEDLAPIEEALEQAKGFLRARVAAGLNLRRALELKFKHDAAARRAVELGQLIDAARARERSPD